jgi:hypothetical protein
VLCPNTLVRSLVGEWVGGNRKKISKTASGVKSDANVSPQSEEGFLVLATMCCVCLVLPIVVTVARKDQKKRGWVVVVVQCAMCLEGAGHLDEGGSVGRFRKCSITRGGDESARMHESNGLVAIYDCVVDTVNP